MVKNDKQSKEIVNLQELADILGFNKTHLSRYMKDLLDVKDKDGKSILRPIKIRENGQARYRLSEVLKVGEMIGTQARR